MQDGLVLWLDARAQRQLMKDGQSKSIWKDLSGNGNDGQLMNFGYTEDSGWGDGGLKFDGVDDTVEIPKECINEDEDFTIEILAESSNWVSAKALLNKTSRSSTIWNEKGFGVTNIYTPHYLYVSINDGVEQKFFKINSVDTYDNSSIVIKKEGTMLYTFFNNGKIEYDISEFGSFRMDNNIKISQGYDSNIKLIRIYNRALTDEEILQNYQATHFLLEPKTFPPTNSYYNFEDLNRVEINTLATKDLVEALRGEVNLGEIDIDRDMKSIPFADVLNRVEGNINILGNKLYKPKGWIQPKLDWRYNQPFSYEDANRLEYNLLLLYNYAKGNIDKIPYCGMYTCGEEVI